MAVAARSSRRRAEPSARSASAKRNCWSGRTSYSSSSSAPSCSRSRSSCCRSLINAPLLNRANPDITPNPSKAPWYFLNLQELLLHMDTGLAGVIVPTVALIVLVAVPYIDRSNEGQGVWFGHGERRPDHDLQLRLVRRLDHPGCILWDDGAHVRVYAQLPRSAGDRRRAPCKWLGDKTPVRVATRPVEGVTQSRSGSSSSSEPARAARQWHWSLPVPFQPGSGATMAASTGRRTSRRSRCRSTAPGSGTGTSRAGCPAGCATSTGTTPTSASRRSRRSSSMPIVDDALLAGAHARHHLEARLGAHRARRHGSRIFTGFIMVYFSLTIIGAAFRGTRPAARAAAAACRTSTKTRASSARSRQPASHYVLSDPRSGIVSEWLTKRSRTPARRRSDC